MKLYFRVLGEIARRGMDPARPREDVGPRALCASDFKRMLMIANDSGEMAVVVGSNGILYEAIIDPLS